MAANGQELQGKLVLVTGAGTGIGRGIARVLAEQGADVALHYSSSAQGALSAVEEIRSWGRRAIALQGDLGVVADCRRVVDEAAAFLGGLDGLVNNAGITTTINFLDVTEEQFNRSYHLNIRGEFFCAQQAVPHMVKRGERLRPADPPWAVIRAKRSPPCPAGRVTRIVLPARAPPGAGPSGGGCPTTLPTITIAGAVQPQRSSSEPQRARVVRHVRWSGQEQRLTIVTGVSPDFPAAIRLRDQVATCSTPM